MRPINNCLTLLISFNELGIRQIVLFSLPLFRESGFVSSLGCLSATWMWDKHSAHSFCMKLLLVFCSQENPWKTFVHKFQTSQSVRTGRWSNKLHALTSEAPKHKQFSVKWCLSQIGIYWTQGQKTMHVGWLNSHACKAFESMENFWHWASTFCVMKSSFSMWLWNEMSVNHHALLNYFHILWNGMHRWSWNMPKVEISACQLAINFAICIQCTSTKCENSHKLQKMTFRCAFWLHQWSWNAVILNVKLRKLAL